MYRTGMIFLEDWLHSRDRRPLVIRGARQVGKTWLVRQLAEQNGRELIEINLESRPDLASLFSNSPKETIFNLNASLRINIKPERSLLFLDEIQAAPELFPLLRWFAEEMPELPVIAAGSLLEFLLAKHTFSMPVGRIEYMYLEPLSFVEFLHAINSKQLVDYLNNFNWQNTIPNVIHEQLMALFKEYLIVGGMPQVVAQWVAERSLLKVSKFHHNLITTYRDDFAKYAGRVPTERLDEVMRAVPRFLGKKFIYSKVNIDEPSSAIKQSLQLLFKARVCHKVAGTAANGIPLGAEIQDKYLKVIFLDVGLCSTILDLSFDQLQKIEEISVINSGAIAEQVVGQLLRTINPFFAEPALYYWHREVPGSDAEIDYVIQHEGKVVPIEVKAGKSGTLKSLHAFMKLKKRTLAVRINSDVPSKNNVDVELRSPHEKQASTVQYMLVSMPFYLIHRVHELLK